MRTITISLPPDQADRIETAVASGDYASNSEVVRDALRLWEEAQARRESARARLRRDVEEGLASGAGRAVTADELIAAFHAKSGR